MQKGNKHFPPEQLKSAFESGYQNACTALSLMTSDKVGFKNFHVGFHRLDSEFFSPSGTFGDEKRNILLTTEIFGDITGKSYLFLSEHEFSVLTATIPNNPGSKINLKDEFIKELDNIVSASVITKLANSLNTKMYGDIPILIDGVSCKIEDLIFDDFSENAGEVYINSIHFALESNPTIRPFFIWVIESDALEVKGVKTAKCMSV